MDLAELLVNENVDQVLALNARFEIIVWNKACELITGLKKEEAIGKSVFSVFPEMRSEQANADALDAALRGEKSFVPYNRTSAEGFVEKHFIPLAAEQSVIGVLIVKHDVAHREKVESELRVLNKSLENFKCIIDSAHDAIVTFDANGNITYWNAAAEKLYSYTAIEIMGRSAGCLLPSNMTHKATEIIEGLRTGSFIDVVIKQVTKSGKEIDVVANIFPLKDEDNNFIGGCKIVKDVTDLLKYQHSIEALNKELTIKNRQLASVNSELKTFTNIAVNNYSETLRQLYLHFEYITAHEAGKLSDPGKGNIRKAQAAIQKMKLLTSDIAAFTRLNEFGTDRSAINLSALISTVIDDLKEKTDTGNTEFIIDALPVIHGNPFLVSMIFHHLLDNAVKFKDERRTLVVRISAQAGVKGDTIHNEAALPDAIYDIISIADNGIGFPKEQEEHIFSIFTRLDQKRKGSGIGLAMCKKAMELHCGFIITATEPGIGATFSCCFPRPDA